jgi:tetratricopeptide (TPR) repeat protein
VKASRHTVTLSLLALVLLEPTFFAAQTLAQKSGKPSLNNAVTPSPVKKTSGSAYALGVQLYTAKRYKEASKAFWQAITNEGGEAPAWLYMAHSCLGAGDRASALKYYQSVYKLYSNREEGLVAKQYITRLATSAPMPIEEKSDEDEKANLPSKSTNLENITLVRPVVGHPEVDPYLIKEIQASIKKIPAPIRAYLERAKIKIVLTPTMIDKYPAGAYQEAAGYEGGTDKSCPGLFEPATREIVLAQHTVSEHTDEVEPAESTSAILGTLLHECGHALDFSVRNISLTDDYRFNYYKDIARIPDDVAPKIRYYLQKDEHGQLESCGELMGILMGNEGRDTSLMKQYFPNCIAFLKKKLGIF